MTLVEDMHHDPILVSNQHLVPFGESVHIQLAEAGKKQLVQFGENLKAHLLHEYPGLRTQDTLFFRS